MVVQVVGLLLALVLNILWARFLGPRGFGHYSWALSWVNILAVVGSMGWGAANVRLIPKLLVEKRHDELRGLIRGSLLFTCGFSVLIGCLYVVIVPSLYPDIPDALHFMTAVLVLPFSLLLVVSGQAKGFKKVVPTQVVHLIIRSLLMMVFMFVAWRYLRDFQLSYHALFMNILASAISLGILLMLVRRHLKNINHPGGVRFVFTSWLVYSIPMFGITVLNVLNNRVGILALGRSMDPAIIGQYAACCQLSLLAGFGLAVVGLVTQPYLSEMHSKQDVPGMQSVLRFSARGALVMFVPVVLAIVFGGKFVLGLMSNTFVAAYPVLLVLAAGQMFSVMAGQVGTLLVMADLQNWALAILGGSVVLHVFLLFALIPLFGMMGAALASISTTLFWNLAMSLVAWRKLNLRATVA